MLGFWTWSQQKRFWWIYKKAITEITSKEAFLTLFLKYLLNLSMYVMKVYQIEEMIPIVPPVHKYQNMMHVSTYFVVSYSQ